ncbi:MAG TPA: hypothetical protein VEW28_10600 [Candidatus Kapabacteria bacterium]|nr:hypothetical protein [Candidatus Kapabacteria bacterium]
MQTLRSLSFVVITAAVLTGCGTKYRVDIDFRNGSSAEYSLVSVRDSSVVVLPSYERTDYLAYTHMLVIANTDIYRLKLPVEESMVKSLPMMLIGAAVGATIGKPCDCEDKLSKAVIGLAIGWNLEKIVLLVEALNSDYLYLWNADDKKRLREAAIFPSEPPIMKYMR